MRKLWAPWAIAAGSLAFFVALEASAVGVAARVNRPHPVGVPVDFAANGVGSGELTFTWDFGDGQKSEPSADGAATHTYETPGHYAVIVVVQDETGSRSDSFLQTVHRVLPPAQPTSSSTIAYNRAHQRICNVNVDNDTISCLSTENFELLFEVPVGRHPRSIAVSPDGTLWVTNQDDATVSVLDPNGSLLAVLPLPRASKPFGLAMNSSRGVAYVALQATGELVALDLSNGALVSRVKVGPWATGVSVDVTGERIFVTRFISPADGGQVIELSAADLEVKQRHVLALDPGPDTEASARGVPNYIKAAVPNPDGSELWVPSKKDNILRGPVRDGEGLTFETSVRTIVSMFDLATNTELLARRVDLNNRTLGLSLTFSPIGDYAFVGLLGNNGLEVVDTYNGNVVAGEFELGKAPDGLVLDDNGRLYVNSFLSRSVVVLEAAPLLASRDFAIPKIAEVIVSSAEKLDPVVLEGKIVFYDASDLRMGKDGYISCAVCHLDGFEDGQVWDFTDRGEGLRNTTSLLGKRGTGQGRLHWTGNFDEVQDFEHDIRGAFGGTGFLPDEVFNEGTRNTTLGDAKAGLSPELDAMAAYVTSLDRVNPSPYRAEDGALTEAGLRGLEIFERSGCPECHSGADFTDSASGMRHDVGTLVETSGKRLGETLDGIDTPTLRGIWETGPYFHDGSAATLLEVIGARNQNDEHGTTQSLSAPEKDDLVSYLLQIDNTARQDEVRPSPGEPSEPSEPGEPSEPTEPTDPDGSGTTTGGGCSTQSNRNVGAPGSWVFGLGLFALWRLRRTHFAANTSQK